MKISFLGTRSSFDYFQIGGVESFIRRLSHKIIEDGHSVEYILYGNKENRNISSFDNFFLRYCKEFKDSLKIAQHSQHCINIYIQPKDRLRYIDFRKRSKATLFHHIFWGWPDSIIRRKFYFGDAQLFPYNGKLFCLSRRQYNHLRKWSGNVVPILPPVPENYFLRPEDKHNDERIKITFLGRIDSGKGIEEVIEIFNKLEGNNKFICSLYGIYMQDNMQSLSIHNFLSQQNKIRYFQVDRQNYSPSIEDFVGKVLKETDIFMQPIRELSSTIDTPLLILEAMASLCAVITKPLGNIPDIYGKSRFLLPEKNYLSNVVNLLKNITHEEIVEERKRICSRNNELNYRADKVAKVFLNAISGKQ